MDQRICIKFCVKNEIKCSKALEILTVAFGESTLSQKSVDEAEHSGGATTSTSKENIETVKTIGEPLLGKLQRMLAYQSAHAVQFSQMF